MNVLYLVTCPRPNSGGTTSKVWSLTKESHHNSFVLYPGDLYQSEDDTFWAHTTLHNRPSRKKIINNFLFLNRYIKEQHIDIVHVFFPAETFIAALLKIFNPRLKIVRSFEGCVNYGIILRFCTWLALRKFDKCIYISHYVKDYYSFFNHKCEGVILFNAAAHISSKPIPINKKNDRLYLLSISGLNDNKNLFLLLKLSAELKRRNCPHCIYIAGEGPLKQDIEKTIKELKIDENVVLLGYQTDIPDLLDKMDVYVHPAQNEGFGIAVVEAMARKLPIVVSNRGGLIEIIENGYNGLICDWNNPMEWADAIMKISNDKEFAIWISENAYSDYINKFTPYVFAKTMDELYDCL